MVSKTKLDLVEENFSEIKAKLPEYLKEHGHDCDNAKKFFCISPDHNDSNPSMSVFMHDKGYPIAKCFSCGYTADIFAAAHAIEEKPITGPGFLHENVKYLADKYKIEVSIGNLTEEEIYEISTYDAYKATANFITSFNYNAKCLSEIENREWKEDFLREYMVACCVDYHAMRTHLKSIGFQARFLDEVDLDNQKIFNQENLIFTICDEHGRPVGFSARYLDFDPNKEGFKIPKFTNTKTTGLRCNIFRKSERLYLMHIAKKHVTPSDPLYIVEGYGDTLTLHMNGVKNSVGIASADLSDKQLNLCRKLGIADIVICLDGDETGYRKAKQILDDVLSNVHDLRIRFVFLPWDGENKIDPDKFVREHGIKAFLDLPKIEPFTWRLSEFVKDIEDRNGKLTDSDAQHICQIMIGIIANEPSPLKRESMSKELSNYTGFSVQVIKEELDKIFNAEAVKIQRKKKSVIDNLVADLQSRSDGYEIVIERATQDLEDVNKESKTDIFDSENILSVITNIKQYQENEDLHRTIDFGSNFNTLPIVLAGDIAQKLLFIGGTPNSGKSSKFSNLALNLPMYNPDISTVILTIDDSSKEFMARLVCYDMAKRLYEAGDMALFSELNISKVAQPFLYKHLPEYHQLIRERDISYRRIMDLVQEGRFGIFDASYGKTVSLMRNIIKKFKTNRPDTKLIFFLDNFHQLDSNSDAEGRHKYKELSGDIKNLTTTNDITIISTVEYNKIPPGTKPSNYNVSESGALEYDCNAMMHLYNELHDIRDKSRLYFEEYGQKYPIIEQIIAKNKISSFKGNVFYKFYADKSYYHEITPEEVEELRKMNSFDLFSNQETQEKTKITLSQIIGDKHGRRD